MVFLFLFLFLFILFIYIYREREREREKSKEISTENPGFEANVGSNSIWKLSPFIYFFFVFCFHCFDFIFYTVKK